MLEKYAIESEWMEAQLKTVKWAREQKKKIPEKNTKITKPPGVRIGSPGVLCWTI